MPKEGHGQDLERTNEEPESEYYGEEANEERGVRHGSVSPYPPPRFRNMTQR